MIYRFFVIVTLLSSSSCAGESSVHGPSQTVVAFAGGDVILSCSFSITDSDDFPTVEWSKEGLQPDVIFLYRDGCELYEMKHPSYQYRTSFITKELKNGNVSLRISNVLLSDAGTYRCLKLSQNGHQSFLVVELVVVAVTEPKLSPVLNKDGGVTLKCEACCWLPEPEVRFLDEHGNDIPADEPRRQREASGCYSVTRTVTPQDATSRVTCSVHQPDINQTRVAAIIIPVGCMRSWSLTTTVTSGGMILLLLVIFGLSFLLWRRNGKSADVQTPLEMRSLYSRRAADTDENRMLLIPGTDAVVERLKREISCLRSKLVVEEETNRQLQNGNRCQLSPVVCQLDQPTISCSPQVNSSSTRC